MQLNNLSIYTNDGEFIERGFVRFEGGEIVRVGAGEEPYAGENLHFNSELLMPSLVNSHTHVYSSLARGMRFTPFEPTTFTEILEQLWWRLDRSLTREELQISANVASIESLKCGVTTLFDHNSSPNSIEGSLEVIAEAVNGVGLRYCGSYEVSDRDGPAARDRGVRENLDFSKNNTPMRRGFFGLHASFTLSRETLALVSKEIRGAIPIHVHVAEGPEDQERALSLYDQRVLERFHRNGLMGEGSIYAHCVHTTPAERSLIAETGGFAAVNYQSNVNNGVGLPDWKEFLAERVPTALGNDGFGFNLAHDVRFLILTPHHLARDVRVSGPEDLGATLLGGNYELARKTFGIDLGVVREGSTADLMILDYKSPTVMNRENFLEHFFYGICDNMRVSDVFVSGRRVLANGSPTLVEEREVYSAARKLSGKLNERFEG